MAKKSITDYQEPMYLTSTTNKDTACNRDLYQFLKKEISNSIERVDSVKSLYKYRQLFSKFRLLFSGRIHSLILGKIENCIIVSWLISAKIMWAITVYNNTSLAELKHLYTCFLEKV